MNLFSFKVFKNLRDRIQPKKKWCVTASVWEENSKRYLAALTVTTHARTRKDAENNVKDHLRLHITDAWVVKEHVNGSK